MRDASPLPFWLDRPRPADAPPLAGRIEADLAIVGAGFTGLWAAVLAKKERPDREVVLLDAETAGCGASGRNGGFVEASLTHGLRNGAARFGSELDALEGLARDNLDGMKADLERWRIDAGWQEPGVLTVATQPP
jgi:glycine/D-amino acid oxidase-like deaminating enzyme